MADTYPLEIESVGSDTYIVRSKGHHDPDEFMKAVRDAGYEWPLGYPFHGWRKTVPVPSGWTEEHGYCDSIYAIVPERTRGAYPVTEAQEAWGDMSYERVRETKAAQPADTRDAGNGEASL